MSARPWKLSVSSPELRPDLQSNTCRPAQHPQGAVVGLVGDSALSPFPLHPTIWRAGEPMATARRIRAAYSVVAVIAVVAMVWFRGVDKLGDDNCSPRPRLTLSTPCQWTPTLPGPCGGLPLIGMQGAGNARTTDPQTASR
jgi:hypothetical protein